ncbi:MAG: tetratricopeptide repeat protein [Chakrabartia sp.]
MVLSACSSEAVPNANSIRATYERHDIATARQMLGEALKAHPESPELRLLSGEIALETGNLDYAQAELERISTDPQFGGRARSLLAKAHFLSDNPRKALEVLGSGPPADGLGYGIKALATATLGDEPGAEQLLADGLAKYPSSADLVLLSAMTAFASGDTDSARLRIADAQRLDPRNVSVLAFAARLAIARRDQADAEKWLKLILQAQPDNQFALLALGAVRYDNGDKAGASALFQRSSLQAGGMATVTRYFQAQMAFDVADYKKAAAILKAVPEPRDFAPAARLTGILASYTGDNERAISLLEHYLNNGNEDALARYALAVALGRVGQVDKAWQYLRPIAQAPNANAATQRLAAQLTAQIAKGSSAPSSDQSAPGNVSAVELKAAEAALVAGNWARADAVYSQILAADPQTRDPRLLNNAALAKQMGGDLGRAEALIRRALAAAPTDPIILDTAAWVVFKKYGRTPEALDLSRRALAGLPQDPDVQRHARAITGAR